MKILAPISSPDEVEMLAANGADELYCGFVPREWMETYTGAIWLNRRSPAGANLAAAESLAELVRRAHSQGLPVFLALNAPTYNDSQLRQITELARRAAGEIGVDALIVSDLGLLLTLAELGLQTRIHISSIASALNSRAIQFYSELGASRLILPRALSLHEIADLARMADGQIELEAFILNDGCAFEEGLCHTTHHHRVGAFCWNIARWSWEPCAADGRALAADEASLLADHMKSYREWIWFVNGCGQPLSPNGLPYGPCGLCAIPALARMRIASLKIAGRQASSLRKFASLRLVKAIVDLVRSGASPAEVAARARQIRNTPELCDTRYMCYYRDFDDA
ncbi:MAG: U32 family peptidase [Acidobacteria bacterium]|nr:U32 family peptidase [Acidobacteriota bacterium]